MCSLSSQFSSLLIRAAGVVRMLEAIFFREQAFKRKISDRFVGTTSRRRPAFDTTM